jgi:hypothetical protein
VPNSFRDPYNGSFRRINSFVLVLTSSPFVILRFKTSPAGIGLHFRGQDNPILFAGFESR